MGRKKKNPSIFDALASAGITSNDPQDPNLSYTNVDDLGTGNDVDDVTDIDDPANKAEGNPDKKDPYEDNTDIPLDILNKMNNNPSNPQDNDDDKQDVQDDDDTIDEPDENETAQVGAFFDAFAEALNWEVDEDERPTSVQGIIDYMTNVVRENSVPQYADERVQKLDEYIRNGGKFDDFYNGMSQQVQYESLDMEDEANQKAIVREFLKYQGYTESQINSKIERYEDSDLLEEEANDALDRMKLIREAEIREQEEQQREAFERQQQQTKQFITDLSTTVSSLSEIRGVAVPKEDRKKLYDYITRVDADGLTQYQKDFNKNLVNNLVESAYFTMKGDSIISGARNKGRTDAATNLRNILRHSTKNRSSQMMDDDKRSAIDIASQYFR